MTAVLAIRARIVRSPGFIALPLSISGTPVTTGQEGVVYTGFSVAGANGTAPYTYSVASGSLPPGLTLNSSSGAVSGTPTTAGAYASIVLRVTDNVSATADLAPFTITISAAGAGTTGQPMGLLFLITKAS